MVITRSKKRRIDRERLEELVKTDSFKNQIKDLIPYMTKFFTMEEQKTLRRVSKSFRDSCNNFPVYITKEKFHEKMKKAKQAISFHMDYCCGITMLTWERLFSETKEKNQQITYVKIYTHSYMKISMKSDISNMLAMLFPNLDHLEIITSQRHTMFKIGPLCKIRTFTLRSTAPDDDKNTMNISLLNNEIECFHLFSNYIGKIEAIGDVEKVFYNGSVFK